MRTFSAIFTTTLRCHITAGERPESLQVADSLERIREVTQKDMLQKIMG